MSTLSKSLWPISVQLIAITVSELNRHNISTQEILKGSEITEQMLFNPETMLSYRTTVTILNRALELSPIKHLGFALGNKQSPSSMGILGYLCNCCATIEEALNMTVKYQKVPSTLLQIEWYKEDRFIYWKSKSPIDLGELLPCLLEEESLTLYKSFEMLTGGKIQFLEMHFQYPEPEYVSLYKQAFNCPLFFSADENIIIISDKILSVPILQANSLSITSAERLCKDFIEKNPIIEDIEMSVRKLIDEQVDIIPDEEFIAGKLNITSRTLRNKLALLGTSYRSIINSVRKKAAISFLHKTTLTISEIAEKTGYSDARSFRRAFKQWTSTTPDEYRKRTVTKQPQSKIEG